MSGPVKSRPRTLSANEVGIAADRLSKNTASGKTHNVQYRRDAAVTGYAKDNPGRPITTAAYNYNNPYIAGVDSQGPANTPTVITDSNVREKVIPQLHQDASDQIAQYTQNKAGVTQQQQQQANDANKNSSNSQKDSFSSLFGEEDSDTQIDPFSQRMLDNLDSLSKSQHEQTRNLADAERTKYERQRQNELQVAAAEQGSIGTSLSRLGSRYTPGAMNMVKNQASRATFDKLAQIDDDESSAIQQLQDAQDTKDYQQVDSKLKLLQDIRDERTKTIADHQKQQHDDEQKTQDDINDVIKAAVKSGAPADVITAISKSGDVAEAAIAAGSYLQEGEYADYAREVRNAGLTPVDASTYYARKIYGDKAFDDGSDDPFSGDVPFQATIEGAASYAGSVTGEANAQKQLAELAKNGDYKTLLTRMEGLARKGMGAAQGTDVATAQNQIKAIDNMSNVLKQYQDLGGDVGFLKGNEQTIATRIGKLATDPRFASIATQLTAAFQQYRQQMSGAAFGAAESAQYKSVFPSADKSFELNASVMDGLKNFYQQTVDGAYETQLGEGYSNLKDYVDKGLTPTGKYLLKTEQDAKNKVIQLGQQDPAVQQSVSGFITDHPDASAYDVLQFLGVPVATSNEVSMADTDPSKGVVGGYDISTYASDPNHEKRVASIYKKTAPITDAASADQYIHSIAPGSPVTGDQVMAAAIQTGVTPGMILAIMQQDSTFGTLGKAVRTKNAGNVGNDDSGALKYFPTWEDGVLAVAKNLAKRKVS